MDSKNQPVNTKPQLQETFFRAGGDEEIISSVLPPGIEWLVFWGEDLISASEFPLDLLSDSKPIAFVIAFRLERPDDSKLFSDFLRFIDRKKTPIDQVGYWDTFGNGTANIFKFVDLPFGASNKKFYDQKSLDLVLWAIRKWRNDDKLDLPTLISAVNKEQLQLYLDYPIPISQPNGITLINFAATQGIRAEYIDFVELGGQPYRKSTGLCDITNAYIPEKSHADHADYVIDRLRTIVRKNRLEYKLIEIRFFAPGS